ncbi:MAG TPA: hydrogenase maturation nickel metallochaperone HypA [Burkholderiales bacterium]|nr:hydrogenase maturation nickel metallochaperone HypA [Burkholderiales bacterium]
MHEFSLCEGIVKQVSRANAGILENISQITIEIGKLSGVDVDSLTFWFPVVAEKMACGQVKLEVFEVDGLALCSKCNQQFLLTNLYDACPHCNAYGDYQILQGRELLVKSFSLNK